MIHSILPNFQPFPPSLHLSFVNIGIYFLASLCFVVIDIFVTLFHLDVDRHFCVRRHLDCCCLSLLLACVFIIQSHSSILHYHQSHPPYSNERVKLYQVLFVSCTTNLDRCMYTCFCASARYVSSTCVARALFLIYKSSL